ETLCRRLLLAHVSQLMLHQRMIDDGRTCHGLPRFLSRRLSALRSSFTQSTFFARCAIYDQPHRAGSQLGRCHPAQLSSTHERQEVAAAGGHSAAGTPSFARRRARVASSQNAASIAVRVMARCTSAVQPKVAEQVAYSWPNVVLK